MKKYIDEDDYRNYSMETLEYFVKKYDNRKSSINKIRAAYDFAAKRHVKPDGTPVLRKSGEPYITHPVAVANFLAIMRVDIDTICAGLLHDIIEDTKTKYPEIEAKFGKDVADLVEGVTNLGTDLATQTKIVDSLLDDPRKMVIKLCDRLHNMLTIKFKTRAKQKEKAIETLSLYVPIANKMGIYKIQQELENASFKVLAPRLYKSIKDAREELKQKDMPLMNNLLDQMTSVIKENVRTIGHFNMSETIGKNKDELLKKVLFKGPKYSRARIKHAYGIYDALSKLKTDKDQDTFEFVRSLNFDEETLNKIHDLRVVKLIMKDEISCFLTLNYLHQTFPHIDKYLKDYINSPKYNMYKSLHTTIVVDGKYVQFQIRTIEQELRNTYGLAWELYRFEGPSAREKIVEEFKKYPAYNKLLEINEKSSNLGLTEYKSILDRELLNTKEITVINKDTGRNMTVRDDYTIHDFAYAVGGVRGEHLVRATVNDQKYELDIKDGKVNKDYYPFGELLKNGDEVSVEFDDNIICPIPVTDNELVNNNKKLVLKLEEKKRKEKKEE